MRRRRIERNFLSIVQAKNEETKKFLEELKDKEERRLVIKDSGVVFVYSRGNEIMEITTIEQLCSKMAKEILSR